MADNKTIDNGGLTDVPVATDEVTHSGDTADVQLFRSVHVAGSEGSKTVVAITGSTGSAVPAGAMGVGGTDGTNLRLLKTDASGELQVDVLTHPGVAGDVAHDGGDSGNPVKIGAKAVAHGANPTAVAAGDRTDLYANRAGVPFAIGGHPNVISYTHTAITTAVTDSALITVGAGTKIVVTALTVTLDNASTVFPSVRIGFGTANVPALGNAGVLLAHGGVPAGGGVNRGDGSGIIGIGADNEDLRITTVNNATGNGLQVTVTYYTIES